MEYFFVFLVELNESCIVSSNFKVHASKVMDTHFPDKNHDMDYPTEVHVEEDEEDVEAENNRDKMAVESTSKPEAPKVKEASASGGREVTTSTAGGVTVTTTSSSSNTSATTNKNNTNANTTSINIIQSSSSKPTTATISPRLMEKINAKVDVTTETVLHGSAEVPPFGAGTDHQAELEQVRKLMDSLYNCEVVTGSPTCAR